MDTLPKNQNINIAQLVSSVAVMLTLFGLNLDAKTQAAIVSLIFSVNVIATWVMHNLINHPKNNAAAKTMARLAVAMGKKIAPALVLFVVMGSLVACSTLQNMTPQDELNATEALFATAEAAYDGICAGANAPKFCTVPADMKAYAEAKAAIQAGFVTAQAAITASGNMSQANITALLQTVAADWNAYNAIVNSTKAKARALGIKVAD